MVNDDRLKTISRCGICLEQYTKDKRAPVACPCGHSYCRLCVAKITKARIINCPICREITFFGFDQLGRNLNLIELLEHFQLLGEDDVDDPTPKVPSLDLTEITDQEFETLDVSRIQPFSEFMAKLVSRTMQSIIEKNQLESQENYHELDYDCVQLQNRTTIEWQSLESHILSLAVVQKTLIKTLNDWRKRMNEFNERRFVANSLPVQNLGHLFDLSFEVQSGLVLVHPIRDDNTTDSSVATNPVEQYSPPGWDASSRLWPSNLTLATNQPGYLALAAEPSEQAPTQISITNNNEPRVNNNGVTTAGTTNYARGTDTFGRGNNQVRRFYGLPQ